MINEITQRMRRQADYYAKKYCNGNNWEYDELLQEIYLSFCISDKRYKNDRGLRFEGFAINNIEHHLSNYFREKAKNQALYKAKDNEITSEQQNNQDKIDFSLFFKDEKVINIFRLRFNEDWTYKEISVIYNVTVQRIKQIIEENYKNKKLLKKIK